jgi:hypothetical protein
MGIGQIDFMQRGRYCHNNPLNQSVKETTRDIGTVSHLGHRPQSLAVHKFAGRIPRKARFGAGFQ